MKELLQDWKPLIACFGLAVLVWFLVKERALLPSSPPPRSSLPEIMPDPSPEAP